MEATGMKRIKVLGITGGVGAGKSTVLDYLEHRYRARVIQLDQAAHMLMEPGQECFRKVVDAFGTDILLPDGSLDRSRMAKLIFPDRARVELLNRIVHPMVKTYIKEEIEKERRKGTAPFLVLEAALLLEDHYDEICDEIWYIHTEDSVRRKRLAESRGYTPEKTDSIMKNQRSETEFRQLCQFTVDNSSDILENTYEQIDKGLKEHGFM